MRMGEKLKGFWLELFVIIHNTANRPQQIQMTTIKMPNTIDESTRAECSNEISKDVFDLAVKYGFDQEEAGAAWRSCLELLAGAELNQQDLGRVIGARAACALGGGDEADAAEVGEGCGDDEGSEESERERQREWARYWEKEWEREWDARWKHDIVVEYEERPRELKRVWHEGWWLAREVEE